MGCRDDAGDVVQHDPGDDVTSDADTLDIANAASGLLGCDAVHPYDPDAAYRAAREWADLLLAENQRYKKALERIAKDGGWQTTWHTDVAEPEAGKQPRLANHAQEIAREALAGDTE